MNINWNKYDQFIAECYEAEDEFWDKYFEDIEADKIISEQKEFFEILTFINNLIC